MPPPPLRLRYILPRPTALPGHRRLSQLFVRHRRRPAVHRRDAARRRQLRGVGGPGIGAFSVCAKPSQRIPCRSLYPTTGRDTSVLIVARNRSARAPCLHPASPPPHPPPHLLPSPTRRLTGRPAVNLPAPVSALFCHVNFFDPERIYLESVQYTLTLIC